MITKNSLYDIIDTTYSCHRRSLDAETMFAGWPTRVVNEAMSQPRSEDELVDFLRRAFEDRQRELAIARWWEAN